MVVDASSRSVVLDAIQQIEKHTCIKFIYDNNSDHIVHFILKRKQWAQILRNIYIKYISNDMIEIWSTQNKAICFSLSIYLCIQFAFNIVLQLGVTYKISCVQVIIIGSKCVQFFLHENLVMCLLYVSESTVVFFM